MNPSSTIDSKSLANTIQEVRRRRRLGWLIFSLVVLGVGLLGMLFQASGPGARNARGSIRPELTTASMEVASAPGPEQRDSAASPSVDAEVDWIEPDALAWSRFRGPNGSGVSSDATIPTAWSETQNLKWSTSLPGPGSSSPVLTDRFVFVTCYAGIEPQGRQADTSNLKRLLVCINREDGSVVWKHTEDGVQPEDRYQGMGVPEHGYATNTPVTDGKRVFAFLGKSGVFGFDLEGNKLWHTSVGTESGNSFEFDPL